VPLIADGLQVIPAILSSQIKRHRTARVVAFLFLRSERLRNRRIIERPSMGFPGSRGASGFKGAVYERRLT
jgi:hypothetical protein